MGFVPDYSDGVAADSHRLPGGPASARAVQMKPRDSHARMWLARAYARAGSPDRARTELEALASLDPTLADRVKAELGALAR